MRRLATTIIPILAIIGLLAQSASAQNLQEANVKFDEAALVVSGVIAGLGGSGSTAITVTADVIATFACQNRGENFPRDPRRQAVEAAVTETAVFNVIAGRAAFEVTLDPPESPNLNCPGNQREVIVNIEYRNVILTVRNLVVNLGNFSRIFFVL